MNSAVLKQGSRVHDKVEAVRVAISQGANISAQIENKSWWVMLSIWRAMLAIPRIMPVIPQIMDAIHRVQGISRLVQRATSTGGDVYGKSQIEPQKSLRYRQDRKGRQIVAALTNSASFANPNPPLAEVTASIDDLEKAFAAVQTARSDVATRVGAQDTTEKEWTSY